MNEEGAFELTNINDVPHDSRLRDSLDERLLSFLKVLYAEKAE